jgi:hypothetical protein
VTRQAVRRIATLVSVAVIAGGALAGCSGHADDSTPPKSARPGPHTQSPADDAPTPSNGVVASARLVAEPRGGWVSCMSHVKVSDVVAMYEPIARADGDVTITGARAVGTKVRLVGTEGVVVTADPAFGPGSLTDDTWPITGKSLRSKTDVSTRQELRGMRLTDGQRVLPLFAVRVVPGGTLDGLELTYTDASDSTRSVTLPMRTRFARGVCSL